VRRTRLITLTIAVLIALAVGFIAVSRLMNPRVSPSTLDCTSTPAATIEGMPTPTTCVDTGFRPDPHGFSFPNWAGTSNGDDIAIDTLVALFGARNVCIDITSATCAPRPAAVQWAAQMNELLANGRCEGMSVQAERFFTGLEAAAQVDPGAQTASDLSKEHPALIAGINYWWATQLMPEVASAASASRALLPSRIVTDVVTGLRQGTANTMGVYSNQGAHSLTPFAVTYAQPYFSVWVYDSNHPGQAGRVLVDASNEQWHYQSTASDNPDADGGWTGVGAGGLEYTPMSVRMEDFTAPFSDDPDENAFALAVVATSADTSTEVDLVITGTGVVLNTAGPGIPPDGYVVQHIDDDGIGYGTLVYVRPPSALTIIPNASEAGVPVRVSLDGPRLPWQEVTFTTSGVGDQPVHIEVSADSGTRIVTTGSIPVTVTFDAGESALSTLTSTSSGVLSVPARSALD
jgi:hypothetical protein